MTRSRVQIHRAIAIILRSLVLIHDAHANRGAQGNAKLGTGLDLNFVFLVARGGDGALSRATACHLGLDVGFGQLHAWRHAVDDAAHAEAVRFAIAVEERSAGGGS